jgi:DNA polymerase/3'-5' exonuclease PolX
MSTGVERPIRDMIPIALQIIGYLAAYCERIAIAGSIRRGKPMVKDVEIVAQARSGVLDRRCEELFAQRVFHKRQKINGHLLSWGPRFKAAWYGDVPLDLFIVLPDRSWGTTFLIRTGPADANGVLVTHEGIRNRDGNIGILPKNMRFDEGRLWQSGIALDTPEEEDVFRCVGLPWLKPHLRSVEAYQMGIAGRDAIWEASGQGFRQIYPMPNDRVYLDGIPHRLLLPGLGDMAQQVALPGL